MDPTSKLLVVVDVGSRTLAMAQRVVHQVTEVLAPGCVPLFLTDGLKDYATALLTHFGQWMQPERRQDKGPMPKPRWMPLPALLYAQVVKSYRRRRLVGVTHRVVFGTRLAIEQVLAACGWTINTAFVERLNLDIRQRVAAIGTPGQHAVPGRSGLAGSVGAVPGLSQLCVAPRQSAPAAADSRSHQRPWLGEGVAAVHTGDGGGIDRSRVVAQRGAALPGAAVAATASAVAQLARKMMRATERDRSVYKRARRRERGAENVLRGLTTGCWAPLRRLKRGPMELSAAARYATRYGPTAPSCDIP